MISIYVAINHYENLHSGVSGAREFISGVCYSIQAHHHKKKSKMAATHGFCQLHEGFG